MRESLRRFRADSRAFFKLISPRELDLLPYFAQAWSDEEASAHVGLSVHAVRTHRQNVMHKLDLPDAAKLTHWAIVNGFGGRCAPSSQLPAPGSRSDIGVKPTR